jgi:acyl dehydratase
VLDKRDSGSMPNRGFMRIRNEMVNNEGKTAMSTIPTLMLERRP